MDSRAAVRGVADPVGVTGRIAIDLSFPTVRIQRDANSDDWRARFLRDRADLDLVQTL